LYFDDKPKRPGLNVSTGKLSNGNIAGSRLNHHFVFVKFQGEKMETKETDSRVKSLRVEKGLKQSI